MLAAFPLCTGIICIAIFMKALRRFGGTRNRAVAES
jgi:hypothetical protein